MAETAEKVNLIATPAGKKGKKDNPHRVMRSDVLLPQVDALMERLVIPPEWYDLILAYYLHEDGMPAFEREGYNLRQELDRLRDLYRTGFIDRSEFQTKALWIENQLAKLKPTARPEAQHLIPLLKDFPALWRRMRPEHKRAFLNAIFEGLYFNSERQLYMVLARSPFDKLLGLPEDGILRRPKVE